MVDATLEILARTAKGKTDNPVMYLMTEPVFNIDDMDGKATMGNLKLSGCYVISSSKAIDPRFPGKIFVDGLEAGTPLIPEISMFGQTIGIFLRKLLNEYDRQYTIRFEGARDMDGNTMAPFEFSIRTLPKVQPGGVYPEHDLLVLQAARESAVLLKNDKNTLPLANGSVINAFGKAGPAYRLGMCGAAKINPRYGIRFEEGIKAYSSLVLNQELFDFYRDEKDVAPPADLLERATAVSDTAVVLITRGTAEGKDNLLIKGDYYLTDDEDGLLAAVSEKFARKVVILNTGYPIEMGWIEKYNIDTVLWSGLNGMAGGRALAEILDGTVTPSGRLPDSWPFDYHDLPASRNYYLPEGEIRMGPSMNRQFTTLVYEEGLYVGYRYYTTFNKKAAFIFGHGLSYTAFDKKCTAFRQEAANVRFSIEVANTGRYFGKESVLVYARIPDGKLEQPALRLVGFAKTDELAPGSREVLTFEIPARQFMSYLEADARWIIEPGTISLLMGGAADQAIEFSSFAVPVEILISQVKNRLQPPLTISELSKNDPAKTYPQGKLTGYHEGDDLPFRRWRENTPENRPVKVASPEHLITFPDLVRDENLVEPFVAQLSDYELCRLSVGSGTGWGFGGNGFAGKIYNGGQVEKYQIPEFYCSDGNNGLNMNEPNIGFPVSNLMAAAFNERLCYENGRAIAKEARGMNLNCILAPAMNLHRNLLCGRNAEYFSEDPYLTGRLAGMQSKGLESAGISSSIKHLFANNAETYRNSSHSLMTERTARELYLKCFEVALDVHQPDTIMTSYNPANGVWCAGDDELLQGIVREEWGFSGMIMTDWGSTRKCDAILSTQAGNCWITPGDVKDTEVLPMVEALQDGRLDRERLKSNVRDILAVLRKYYFHA